jgi:hypothetical protein
MTAKSLVTASTACAIRRAKPVEYLPMAHQFAA